MKYILLIFISFFMIMSCRSAKVYNPDSPASYLYEDLQEDRHEFIKKILDKPEILQDIVKNDTLVTRDLMDDDSSYSQNYGLLYDRMTSLKDNYKLFAFHAQFFPFKGNKNNSKFERIEVKYSSGKKGLLFVFFYEDALWKLNEVAIED